MEYDSNQVIFSIKDSGELVDPRLADQEAEYYLVYASQEEDRWGGNVCKIVQKCCYLLQSELLDIDHIFQPTQQWTEPGSQCHRK